jgi:hypothetical protein
MDNTGKTTLAMKLHEKLHVPLIKAPPVVKMGLDRCMAWDQQLLGMCQDQMVIMDRIALISQAVYGPVLTGRNVLVDHPEYPQLVQQFLKAKPLVIFCYPGLDAIRNWGSRDQMAGVMDHSDALAARYEQVILAIRPWVEVVPYDYNEPAAFQKVLDAVANHYNFQPSRYPEHYALAAFMAPEKHLHGPGQLPGQDQWANCFVGKP